MQSQTENRRDLHAPVPPKEAKVEEVDEVTEVGDRAQNGEEDVEEEVEEEEKAALLGLITDDAVAAYDGRGKFIAIVANPTDGHESPLVVGSEVGMDRDAIRRPALEGRRRIGDMSASGRSPLSDGTTHASGEVRVRWQLRSIYRIVL